MDVRTPHHATRHHSEANQSKMFEQLIEVCEKLTKSNLSDAKNKTISRESQLLCAIIFAFNNPEIIVSQQLHYQNLDNIFEVPSSAESKIMILTGAMYFLCKDKSDKRNTESIDFYNELNKTLSTFDERLQKEALMQFIRYMLRFNIIEIDSGVLLKGHYQITDILDKVPNQWLMELKHEITSAAPSTPTPPPSPTGSSRAQPTQAFSWFSWFSLGSWGGSVENDLLANEKGQLNNETPGQKM